MMRRICVILMAAMFVPSVAAAQTTTHDPAVSDCDVQARVGFDVTKQIKKGFNVSWEEELRLRNNFGAVDRIHSSLGTTYRIAEWFRVGAAYTFIARWHDGKKSTDYEKYWDLRHRASADAMFTLKSGKWRFSLRERGQFTFRTDSVNTREKSKCDIVMRHRLKVDYKVFHLPLRPYASVEMSHTLNAPKLGGNYIDKVRSMLGVEWRLSKESTLEFYYRFDYAYGIDIDIKKTSGNITITPEKGYYQILGVFYSYSF